MSNQKDKQQARRKRYLKAKNIKNNNIPLVRRRGITITQKTADKVARAMGDL